MSACPASPRKAADSGATPEHYTGTITWIEGERFEQFKAKNAIVRPNEIAFDFDCGDPGFPFIYTVALARTATDFFEGQFFRWQRHRAH